MKRSRRLVAPIAGAGLLALGLVWFRWQHGLNPVVLFGAYFAVGVWVERQVRQATATTEPDQKIGWRTPPRNDREKWIGAAITMVPMMVTLWVVLVTQHNRPVWWSYAAPILVGLVGLRADLAWRRRNQRKHLSNG